MQGEDIVRTAPYHHGHLKTAILDAAESMLSRTSLDAISMRQLAREAGVSSGAPYHHFGDRSGLVAALCQRGFSRLGDMLRGGRERDGIRGMIETYLEFARNNQALYQLMFSVEATAGANAEALHPYAGPVFTLLEEQLAQAGNPVSTEADGLTAISVWCFMHGLASLGPASPLQIKLAGHCPDEFAFDVVNKLICNTA